MKDGKNEGLVTSYKPSWTLFLSQRHFKQKEQWVFVVILRKHACFLFCSFNMFEHWLWTNYHAGTIQHRIVVLRLYVCIYMHMYMYTHISNSISTSTSILMSISIYFSTHTHTDTHKHQVFLSAIIDLLQRVSDSSFS